MTAAPKLTAAQVAVLRELAKPGARARLSTPKIGLKYWFVNTSYKKCSKQITPLAIHGFVLATVNGHMQITPAGRSYLAMLDA